MKLWPVVAVATMSSAFVWACQGDPADDDGGGGQAGAGTGGGDTETGGSGGGSGGDPSLGGSGGTSCDAIGGLGGLGGEGGSSDPAIFGEWTDQYGGNYSIDAEAIDSGYGVYHIDSIDEDAQSIVAQNDENNSYFPELFSRFDWSVNSCGTFICQVAYDAESASDALDVPAADRADLMAGCNGFPWSHLTPQ